MRDGFQIQEHHRINTSRSLSKNQRMAVPISAPKGSVAARSRRTVTNWADSGPRAATRRR